MEGGCAVLIEDRFRLRFHLFLLEKNEVFRAGSQLCFRELTVCFQDVWPEFLRVVQSNHHVDGGRCDVAWRVLQESRIEKREFDEVLREARVFRRELSETRVPLHESVCARHGDGEVKRTNNRAFHA